MFGWSHRKRGLINLVALLALLMGIFPWPAAASPLDRPGLSTAAAPMASGPGGAAPSQPVGGNAWSWGHNTWGQLGDNSFSDSAFPVPVSGVQGLPPSAA